MFRTPEQEARNLCDLCALSGELRRSFTTARRIRNQTCTYRTLAGIVGEGNISARLATNLGISSTEGTEGTEKAAEEKLTLWEVAAADFCAQAAAGELHIDF